MLNKQNGIIFMSEFETNLRKYYILIYDNNMITFTKYKNYCLTGVLFHGIYVLPKTLIP